MPNSPRAQNISPMSLSVDLLSRFLRSLARRKTEQLPGFRRLGPFLGPSGSYVSVAVKIVEIEPYTGLWWRLEYEKELFMALYGKCQLGVGSTGVLSCDLKRNSWGLPMNSPTCPMYSIFRNNLFKITGIFSRNRGFFRRINWCQL